MPNNYSSSYHEQQLNYVAPPDYDIDSIPGSVILPDGRVVPLPEGVEVGRIQDELFFSVQTPEQAKALFDVLL